MPEEIRGDVRRAVGGEEEEAAPDAPPAEEGPLVREMFDEDDGGGIDDFDLSQLRSCLLYTSRCVYETGPGRCPRRW